MSHLKSVHLKNVHLKYVLSKICPSKKRRGALSWTFAATYKQMESHSTETFLSPLSLEPLATFLPLRATVPLDQNPSFKALNAISKNLAAACLDSKLKCSR